MTELIDVGYNNKYKHFTPWIPPPPSPPSGTAQACSRLF